MRAAPEAPAGSSPAPPPPRSPRRAGSLRAALGWTALHALLPGTGFLATGRRVLGAVVLGAFLLLAAGGVWLATAGQRSAFRASVDTTSLLWIVGGVGVLTALWCVSVVAGYLLLVPRRLGRGRQVLGGVVVVALLAAVVVPAVTAGRLALTQRDLIADVFTDDGRSATVDDDEPSPFGTQERVNVLLLGGDGGEGREGVRTDTVIVASIDTDDGTTTLFSLPRNLEDLPFPEDSPLGELYPDGFDAGSESESLLNAVYRNGPAMYPDALGPTDNAGADFLKLGVGEALGLDIDYYVLINLEGFSRLVDALGGITVDVNYWVPVGGIPDEVLPDDYIAPGPNRRMDGTTALAFARGRFGLTDYDRMDRQRCTIDAIVDAADPLTLLRKYQQLARTTKDIVLTDIPRSTLGDFVDLAFLVKDAEIRSVVFDDSVIVPAYPDYDLIRGIVSRAIASPAPPEDGAGTQGEVDAEGEVVDDGGLAGVDATPSAPGTGLPTSGPPAAPSDVRDACAYDPVRAAQELAAGMPPTRGD